MLKAVKIRLYPNTDQINYINNLLGSCRFVYNQCLQLKIKEYTQNNKSIGLKELGNFFHQTLTKNEEYSWLQEHNTKVLKQSIINLLDSYKRFFVNGAGFPKYKSRKENKLSCRFPLETISRKNNYLSGRLTLSGIKNIKYKTSDRHKIYLDKHKSGIRSATLTKTKCNQYFLSILVDGDVKQLNKPKNDFIGIDLGIKTFIVDSNNNSYENIKIKRNNGDKLKRLNQLLSRKQKGSKNKDKARIKLAKFHNKLNNQKENYLHEISNQLLNENQVIIMEDLNVSGMLKNHKLAKSIQELSLSRFKTILEYKANWYNRDIIQIDRFYPSSKLCSNCGEKNTDLTLEDRTWICPACKVKHDRDFNAAKNILKEGKKLLNNRIPIRNGELDESLNAFVDNVRPEMAVVVELGNKTLI
jgi:putative transposase